MEYKAIWNGMLVLASIKAVIVRFDLTTGVSITVNIGTTALLSTLHDTFDPLRLRGSNVS